VLSLPGKRIFNSSIQSAPFWKATKLGFAE